LQTTYHLEEDISISIEIMLKPGSGSFLGKDISELIEVIKAGFPGGDGRT
jgi:hypothetical protein